MRKIETRPASSRSIIGVKRRWRAQLRCMFPRAASLLKGCCLVAASALAVWSCLPPPPPSYLAAPSGGVSLGPASLDASERYLVHRFVAEAAAGAESGAASAGYPCLALHSSLGAAHHVVEQAALWNASVSHAIFAAPQDVGAALRALRHLRRCHPQVRDRVNFHVVYPLLPPPDGNGSHLGAEEAGVGGEVELPCSAPEDALRRLVTREPDHDMRYPQNVMRNVARSSCLSPFVLTADVDMLPPGDGLQASRLRDFLASEEAANCTKCAFTLPVFEVDSSVGRLPLDKEDLRRLSAAGRARPFHWGFFRENQRALRPFRWLESPSSAPPAAVAFEFGLEPVFVAARGAPPFEESFVGFGFTRNTQAYEMLLAGWRFVLLGDAFLLHRGFQSLRQRPGWRFQESAANERLFRRWLRRAVVAYDRDPLGLLAKYPVKGARVKLKVSK